VRPDCNIILKGYPAPDVDVIANVTAIAYLDSSRDIARLPHHAVASDLHIGVNMRPMPDVGACAKMGTGIHYCCLVHMDAFPEPFSLPF